VKRGPEGTMLDHPGGLARSRGVGGSKNTPV